MADLPDKTPPSDRSSSPLKKTGSAYRRGTSSSLSGSLTKALQTKNQRAKGLIKSSASLTQFFDSDTLREHLLKGLKKGKKDVIAYLASDKTTAQWMDLIRCKELSPASAIHCHWATLTLLSVPEQYMTCLFQPVHIETLFSSLRPQKLVDKVFEDGTVVHFWELPNTLHYITLTLSHFIHLRPSDVVQIVLKSPTIMEVIIDNISEDSGIAHVCVAIAKTECTLLKPIETPPIQSREELKKSTSSKKRKEKTESRSPANTPPSVVFVPNATKESSWHENLLKNLLAKLATDGEEVIAGLNYLSKSLTNDPNLPNEPKQMFATKIIMSHIGHIFELMAQPETCFDATELYLSLLPLHSTPELEEIFWIKSLVKECLADFKPMLISSSALQAQLGMEVIQLSISKKRWSFLKACLADIIASVFQYDQRNIFSCQAFSIFTSFWTNKDLGDTMSAELQQLLIHHGIFQTIQFYCGEENAKTKYLTSQIYQFLTVIPQEQKPPKIQAIEERLKVEMNPEMNECYDVAAKLRAHASSQSLNIGFVDDLPDIYKEQPAGSDWRTDGGELNSDGSLGSPKKST